MLLPERAWARQLVGMVETAAGGPLRDEMLSRCECFRKALTWLKIRKEEQDEPGTTRESGACFSHQRPPRLSPGPICALIAVQLLVCKAEIFQERSAS